ncbi:triose-phosphate isomerase [Helicobacter sp. 12S02232-10]|uniref:triose-phosphate isomerase n=1 Tax=Helicobacter sp. 12S02232-10 TaxID=1476197 RepID=UPI000BA5B958|nr:triose-phosphate isomerase [Helicobacter sp. 12S02232-10]PAF49407.1 triose-phosphate isomerase [Helicobacter sp. 12S02232-10]
MQKIIAANFKANHTRETTKKYLQKLDSELKNSNTNQIYIFPSLASLCPNHFTSLKIGAQNAYPTYKGAFTGEIGLEALEEFDIKTILIGHSERRNILNETQEFCAKKFTFFAEKDFEIIYCIGENISIREKGLREVENFIKTQFEGIDLGYKKLILAYEPIWAIGTGISATIEQIKKTHSIIKNFSKSPLLYGGSVNPKNSSEILSLPEVDGVLVGNASLDVESFYQISQGNK